MEGGINFTSNNFVFNTVKRRDASRLYDSFKRNLTDNCASFQPQHLRHTLRYFLLVMANVYQRYIAHAANGIYQAFKMKLLVGIHPLAGVHPNMSRSGF